MSSKEFWEEDPQLYWAYRTFYFKKMEIEAEQWNYKGWLYGSYSHLGISIALNNAFNKQKLKYPEKPFEGQKSNKEKTELQKKLEKEPNKDIRQQIEYNYWARL